jgi:hypothetical protein
MALKLVAMLPSISWDMGKEGDAIIGGIMVRFQIVETPGVLKRQWAMSATHAPPRHKKSSA